jgi:ATP-binding cassette, subfamily F, member 3
LDDYQKYLLDMAKQRRESLSARNKALSQELKAAPATAPLEASLEAKTTINTIASHADLIPAKGQKSLKNESEALFRSKEQRQQEARERAALAEKAKPLKSRLKQLEDIIAALKAEQEALHNKLIQPLPSAELIEANKRLAQITSEIEDSEWKWLEISERIEGLQAA